MPPPGDFLKFARILVLPVLMAAQGEAAPPSAALRQRLAELVRPEFEVIAWSPTYYADIGLVYDNRAEPCAREIAILQKKAADAPKDAATRQRLGWLLNRHGVPRSGDRWIAEAVRICQQQLVKDGNDEEALARLAILRAGTEEAEQAARKATELHPNSWRAWDALARHQWRKLEQRVLGNLPMSLQEMAIADAPRLERALAAHAADPDLTDALLKLDAEREVHAKRAITNAPESLEPLLSYIHGRLATARIAPTILRLLNEPVPDRVAFDRETLRLLDRAVLLAKDEPAVLGAIGFIQLQMKIATLQAAAARAVRPPPPDSPPNRVPPPPPVKIEQRALPVFAKLRDLIDKSPEAAKSAAATEAFAGLLALIHLSGATTTPVAELPRLVEAAIGQAPERPLLWDLWLDQKFAAAARGELSGEELRQLAQRRLKQMPTGRSHAMVAFASRGEEARVAWLEAAKVEPSNIEFLLNLAATMLSDNQNPQTIDSAIAIVQRATQLSYQDVSWQKPRLDAFRLRTYAVCLILKGDTERAHALLIERLKEFPGDIASKAIRDALVSE